MNTSIPREKNNQSRQPGEIAATLVTLLRSYDHVAYVVGVKQTRTVRNWVENNIEPANPRMKARLEVAEVLASTVQEQERPWVSAAWLIANNPYLDEEVPSDLIQSLTGDASDRETVERLQFAATQFAEYDPSL